MALSYEQYSGNGSLKDFAVTFQYLSRTHVTLLVDGVSVPFIWINSALVQAVTAPATGSVVQVARNTPRNAVLVDFNDGSVLTEKNLDTSALQVFFLTQEAFDIAGGTLGIATDGSYSAGNRRITLVADPVNAQDVVTRGWAESGMSSQLMQAVAAKDAAVVARAAAEAARDLVEADRVAVAADRVIVAADKATVIADKGIVAADKATVNADKGIVAADKAIVAADKATSQSAIATVQASESVVTARLLGAFASDALATAAAGGSPAEGTLYYRTTAPKAMRVWEGAFWGDASSAVNGISNPQNFTATAGQAVFTVAGGYDAGNIFVFVNGVKQLPVVEVDVTSGSTVTFTSGLLLGDRVDLVPLGNLVIADVLLKSQNGADIPNKPAFRTSLAVPFELIEQQSPSGGTAIEFTNFPAGFNRFRLEVDGVCPAVDDTNILLTVQAGGATWQAGGYGYIGMLIGQTALSYYSAVTEGAGGAISLANWTSGNRIGNAPGECLSAAVEFNAKDTASRRRFRIASDWSRPDGQDMAATLVGHSGTSAAITGVRLTVSAGAFKAQGNVKLFGIRA